MKRYILSAAFSLLLVLASVAFAQQPSEVSVSRAADLSTPEAAVRSFVDALNSYDAGAAADCVFQSNRRVLEPTRKNMEWSKKSELKQTITEIEVEFPVWHNAYAVVRSYSEMNKDGKKIRIDHGTELLKLSNRASREAPVWQLLSNDPHYHWSSAQGGSLQMTITLLAHPELMGTEAKCRSNIDSLSRNLASLAKYEWQGKLPVSQKGLAAPAGLEGQAPWSLLKRALMTYEDPKGNFFVAPTFRCPADGDDATRESFAFNDKLDGVELSKLVEPGNTILLYEGKGGKLDFRHDGRAGVAFVDGHVELINAEQAKTLRWMP